MGKKSKKRKEKENLIKLIIQLLIGIGTCLAGIGQLIEALK